MSARRLGNGIGRPVEIHAFDIQAIVGSGFAPLRHCTYHLLRIEDRSLACAWLRTLMSSGLVKSVADLGKPANTTAARLHREIATVGLTYEGLRHLGIRESPQAPFTTAFRMGMTHPERARLIGDVDADQWSWGDHTLEASRRPAVHVVVVHFRFDRAVDAHGPFGTALLTSASGLSLVKRIESRRTGVPRTLDREPFGFRDGISQPVIDGLRPFDGALTAGEPVASRHDDHLVEPGEFILGHLTEYGEAAYCPEVEDWESRTMVDGLPSSFGLNGSYLAVRQIVQKVDAFKAFDRAHPAVNGEPSLAERMIGRRKDGTPLQHTSGTPGSLNRFRYRLDDAEGFRCPVGAHIRRANPRDLLGWDVRSGVKLAKRHRILRRGRVFVDPAPGESGDRHATQGIFFMALNGDLERQFELIQKRWLNNPSFNQFCAGDPIVGQHASTEFAIPALPQGRIVDGIAAFTNVVGGGYFLVPSMTALRFLATRS